MLRDITVGRYVNGRSLLHRLDQRSKIIFTLIFSFVSLSCSSFVSMAVIGILTAAASAASKVPIKYIINGLKPMRWFLLFTVVVDLLFIDGNVIFRIGAVHITQEGAETAALMALRFIFFITSASLLTLTTPPIALTDGFARLMRPLKYIGVPTDDIAMIISITLRSIPSFADEAERIMKAQRARGADFSKGGVISRARAIIPVTIPLFLSVFRRADELSLAMDSRCYGKGSRTPRKKTHFGKTDLAALIIMIFFCGILAIIEFNN